MGDGDAVEPAPRTSQGVERKCLCTLHTWLTTLSRPLQPGVVGQIDCQAPGLPPASPALEEVQRGCRSLIPVLGRVPAREGRKPELDRETRGGGETENMAASIPPPQLRAHSLLRVRAQSTIYSSAQEDHIWVSKSSGSPEEFSSFPLKMSPGGQDFKPLGPGLSPRSGSQSDHQVAMELHRAPPVGSLAKALSQLPAGPSGPQPENICKNSYLTWVLLRRFPAF